MDEISQDQVGHLELLYGVDAIHCGTDIRHFDDFVNAFVRTPHPLHGKVHKRFSKIAGFRLEKTKEEKEQKERSEKAGGDKKEKGYFYGGRNPPLEFKYEFIFHEVEDYSETSIPPVIGCSFHPVGFFKPKA